MTDLLSKEAIMAVADLKTGYHLGHADILILKGISQELMRRREAAEKLFEYPMPNPELYKLSGWRICPEFLGRIREQAIRIGGDYGPDMEGVEAVLLALKNITPTAQLINSEQEEPTAWMVVRDGDATFPRLYKTEVEADSMVRKVDLNPRAIKMPLYAAPLLPVMCISSDIDEEEYQRELEQAPRGDIFVRHPLVEIQHYKVPDQMAISDDMSLTQQSFARGHNACRAAMLQQLDEPKATSDLAKQ
ncbi:hypothetical protein [Pectobacterium versatile]|uniref:hypothetical protein n=1 Tax=Pectobacterium versatile TaxID=2488639 RepID=UPI001BB2D527|nr:hypothetical protein [Pectobacterium versatile]